MEVAWRMSQLYGATQLEGRSEILATFFFRLILCLNWSLQWSWLNTSQALKVLLSPTLDGNALKMAVLSSTHALEFYLSTTSKICSSVTAAVQICSHTHNTWKFKQLQVYKGHVPEQQPVTQECSVTHSCSYNTDSESHVTSDTSSSLCNFEDLSLVLATTAWG